MKAEKKEKKGHPAFLFLVALASSIFAFYFGITIWEEALKGEVRVARAFLEQEKDILGGMVDLLSLLSEPLKTKVERLSSQQNSTETLLEEMKELEIINASLTHLSFSKETVHESRWSVLGYDEEEGILLASLLIPLPAKKGLEDEMRSCLAHYAIDLRGAFSPLCRLLEEGEELYLVTDSFQVFLSKSVPLLSQQSLSLFLIHKYGFSLRFSAFLPLKRTMTAVCRSHSYGQNVIVSLLPIRFGNWGLLFVDPLEESSKEKSLVSMYALLFFISLLSSAICLFALSLTLQDLSQKKKKP